MAARHRKYLFTVDFYLEHNSDRHLLVSTVPDRLVWLSPSVLLRDLLSVFTTICVEP